MRPKGLCIICTGNKHAKVVKLRLFGYRAAWTQIDKCGKAHIQCQGQAPLVCARIRDGWGICIATTNAGVLVDTERANPWLVWRCRQVYADSIGSTKAARHPVAMLVSMQLPQEFIHFSGSIHWAAFELARNAPVLVLRAQFSPRNSATTKKLLEGLGRSSLFLCVFAVE